MVSWGTVKMLFLGIGEALGNCCPWTSTSGNSFPWVSPYLGPTVWLFPLKLWKKCIIYCYKRTMKAYFYSNERKPFFFLKRSLCNIYWLIDWIEFYAISVIFHPCNGGDHQLNPCPPSRGYSSSKSSETVFCVPRGLLSLTLGTI